MDVGNKQVSPTLDAGIADTFGAATTAGHLRCGGAGGWPPVVESGTYNTALAPATTTTTTTPVPDLLRAAANNVRCAVLESLPHGNNTTTYDERD